VVRLRLEILLLADAALIGEPNAGKSSLLARISGATPAVAPYPFTTLDPVLGMVEVGRSRFTVVEVPGLIRGSHSGRGLGDEFLRHAQRARLSVHVVDLSGEDPTVSYEMVREEVRLFDPKMVLRPVVVAANKIDLPDTEEKFHALRRHLAGKVEGVYPVSANTGQGIDALLGRVAEVVEQEEAKGRAKGAAERPSESPQPEARRATGATVEKAADGVFDVHAPSVERLVGGTDLRQWRARVQLWEALRRRGVVRALEKAGAGPGAKVRFGDKELEWS